MKKEPRTFTVSYVEFIRVAAVLMSENFPALLASKALAHAISNYMAALALELLSRYGDEKEVK